MKRRFIPILAALTCVLLLAGCQKAGPSPLPGSDVSSSVPIPETEDTDQSTPSDTGDTLPDLSVNQFPSSSPMQLKALLSLWSLRCQTNLLSRGTR